MAPKWHTPGAALWFIEPWVGWALCMLVALIWLLPDQRIERAISK